MPWLPFEHTADVGIEVRADDLGVLFVDAARGLSDTIGDVVTLAPTESFALEIGEPALDLLLVAWLEELLYRFETERLLAASGEARVEETPTGWQVRATLRADHFDPRRHPLKVPVKAITYHGLEVARDGAGWRARVIFDI